MSLLPEQDVYDDVNLFQLIGMFFRTRILAQLLLLLLVLAALYIPFHHYLPSYRDVWYGLRPNDKELSFENSDQMQFVDEKTGNYLIWYETHPDGYRFFNGSGFYGNGKERELADTDEKIQMLKQWVDRNGVRKKQEGAQTLQLQQSQNVVDGLNAQIAQFKESQKTMQDKIVAQQDEIALLEKQNAPAASTPVSNSIAANSSSAPADAVVVDAAFYNHGAIIPPNPKPLAWFQSLKWGKFPGHPYVYNAANGFFEIPGQPDTRIAPHPHFVIKNNRTGVFDRPFVFFTRIHGMVPREVAIPPLDDAYYQMVTKDLGATFSSEYPYKVTLGGVEY